MSHTNGVTGHPSLQTLLGGADKIAAQRNTPSLSALSSASTTSTDKALLSGAGNVLSQGDVDGDVRTEKVAALKSAIASGTYNVPAAVTADKLISTLLR